MIDKSVTLYYIVQRDLLIDYVNTEHGEAYFWQHLQLLFVLQFLFESDQHLFYNLWDLLYSTYFFVKDD